MRKEHANKSKEIPHPYVKFDIPAIYNEIECHNTLNELQN
jgi:hypothetical protein